jgi:type II secretory pathway pseudopilin PulG
MVELLVSVLVLTIGCLAALSLQARAINADNQAQQVTIAAFLAESQAEKLRTVAFNTVYLEEDAVGKKLTREGEDCPAGSDKICYLRKIWINKEPLDDQGFEAATPKKIEPTPTPGSLVVTVAVWWPANADPKKVQPRVIYDTIISTLDLENNKAL